MSKRKPKRTSAEILSAMSPKGRQTLAEVVKLLLDARSIRDLEALEAYETQRGTATPPSNARIVRGPKRPRHG